MNLDSVMGNIVTIATAIIGVAILAVLVSRNAQTPQVIRSAGDAFSGALRTALGPVSSGFAGAPPLPYGGM